MLFYCLFSYRTEVVEGEVPTNMQSQVEEKRRELIGKIPVGNA